MPDDPAVPDPTAPTGPNLIQRCYAKLDTSQPLCLPTNAVRGILALLIVGGVMGMFWVPIVQADGAVTHWAPQELLILVTAVTAFYFTNPDGNVQMRAILALLIVGGTIAFYFVYKWAPDTFVQQATNVTVLYFGQRRTNGKPDTP